jgi:putative ABC transport system permease protein
MTPRQLVARGFAFYWRSHVAVVAGVATAVAVLAGALLVGDSVRGSLRDLVLQRIGRADRVIESTGFFRDALAGELGGVPLIVMQGAVTEQGRGRRASRVFVYGVDDRFWAFHGVQGIAGPGSNEAFVSRALASDLAIVPGATILVRIERPSAIPIDSLQGRKENPGRTVRLIARHVLDAGEMGDFSIQPQQGSVRAVFVPLATLQKDLDQRGSVDAVLVNDRGRAETGALHARLKASATLDDLGLKVRRLDAQGAVAVESDAGLLDRRRASAVTQAAANAGLDAKPVLTYLANSLGSGDRGVPYSLVSAVDVGRIAPALAGTGDSSVPAIVINDWTARDLGAHVGDPLSLDYYVWQEPGYLETKHADFRIAAIVPIAGAAGDRDLAPAYPGITEAQTFGDWDPPFPIDLKRVRPADEEYWKQYRTTPKAFIPYETGRRLWASPRYGDRTSMRIYPQPGQTLQDVESRFVAALRATIDPTDAGFAILPIRDMGLTASRGSTDFGEYFVYFSFFLVVSALVLAALFFRLGVEQRAREVGLLRAVGYSTRRVRRLFTAEGLLLAMAGSILGVAGAVGYGALMLAGLRTWWSGAVGTRALTLHVSPVSLVAGAAGAVLAAVVCIWWALRGLSRLSERDLLAGRVAPGEATTHRRSRSIVGAAFALAVVAAVLVLLGASKKIDAAGAFFGAGSATLVAGVCAIVAVLRRPPRTVEGHGWPAVVRIGFRNAAERPGRSVLAIAVIASAAFTVISLDAFRRGEIDASDRHAGAGGFQLLVDLSVPLVHDPNSRDGREALGVSGARGVTVVPFRVLPGDDASCLNLYEPMNPRIIGAPRAFLDAGRFSFQGSLASTSDDRANPWRLLEHAGDDSTIPVAADANSLTYVLHKSLGDRITIARGDRTVRLRIVAALDDSILQGELIMSEDNFIRAFPEQQGYRFLLVDTSAADADTIGAQIESAAADYGADAVSTKQRLAEFHAVENTYLSTFQTLGGLGLLVGTIGLAAVLLRNVLERRRELALLRAVGYTRAHVFAIVLAENAVLLACGVGLGAVAAAIAVGPAAMERGARLPLTASGGALVLAVLVAGLISSALATRVALRTPLVGALRSE